MAANGLPALPRRQRDLLHIFSDRRRRLGQLPQPLDVDLVVKLSGVGEHRTVFHRLYGLDIDGVLVGRGRDEKIALPPRDVETASRGGMGGGGTGG